MLSIPNAARVTRFRVGVMGADGSYASILLHDDGKGNLVVDETPHDETIEMLQARFGYFPQDFLWRGQKRHVTAIMNSWLSYEPDPRLNFDVRFGQDAYTITRNVQANTWTIKA